MSSHMRPSVVSSLTPLVGAVVAAGLVAGCSGAATPRPQPPAPVDASPAPERDAGPSGDVSAAVDALDARDAVQPDGTADEAASPLGRCPPHQPAGSFTGRPTGLEDPFTDPGDPRRLPPSVLADRLSRALWREPASAELTRWVTSCAPRSPEDVRAIAQRMLRDPRTALGVAAFADAWLGLAGLATVAKQDPAFTAAVRAALANETRLFVADALLVGPATLRDLFGRPGSFVTPELARVIYDVPAAPEPDFTEVKLDPAVRAGILTQGSVLALTSAADRTMPTRRGHWVWDRLLCRTVIPADPQPGRPGAPAGVATRPWLTAETAAEPCRNCHHLVDPYGFVLDGFDPIGRARPTGSGVDTRATLDVASPPVEIDGPPALAKALAASPEAEACFVRAWLGHATGQPLPVGHPSVRLVVRLITRGRGDLREAMVSSFMSRAFLDP